MYDEHPDKEVMAAIIRLSDALCQWERNTDRESILIIREREYVYRAQSGKPNVPDFVTDEQLISTVHTEIKYDPELIENNFPCSMCVFSSPECGIFSDKTWDWTTDTVCPKFK